jgi:hypothetical protein
MGKAGRRPPARVFDSAQGGRPPCEGPVPPQGARASTLHSERPLGFRLGYGPRIKKRILLCVLSLSTYHTWSRNKKGTKLHFKSPTAD